MILDELVLHDFGVYADRQTITLTPPSPDRPIILFGGLNGGGKTTILDALQLCLFGPQARCSNRNGLAYPDYLAKCVHRRSQNGEAAIELAFRHMVDGREDSYRLHRSWRVTASGTRERFEVIRNDRLDPALTDNWLSQVEDLLPAEIAHLFFFDGEKVEGYAAPESSAALIGIAIQSLLGLDVVDQLDKDLVVLERRKRVDTRESQTQAEIEAAEAEIKTLRNRLETLRSEAAATRTHKIDRSSRLFAELNERYQKLGGDLYDRRIEIEQASDVAQARVDAVERLLKETAAGSAPLLLVENLIKEVARRDEEEEEARQAADIVHAIAARDKALLSRLTKAKASKEVLDAVRQFIKDDGERREEVTGRTRYLNLSTPARLALTGLLRNDLRKERAQIGKLLATQAEHLESLEHNRMARDSIPNEDTLAEIIADRETAAAALKAAQVELAGLEAEQERLARDIDRRQASLVRLLDSNTEARLAELDRERLLTHSARVRETLKTFRQKVIERHVRRIEQLVLESYQQLLRKTSLVANLTIDSTTFELTLFSKSGAPLFQERLSAGERQLLAIALLWGLAKASGRPLPTAIDTPLGRLDHGHRSHMVERYFPHASHQVLLLSTDAEIGSAHYSKLARSIGRSYVLVHDDATGATTVETGYFSFREAA